MLSVIRSQSKVNLLVTLDPVSWASYNAELQVALGIGKSEHGFVPGIAIWQIKRGELDKVRKWINVWATGIFSSARTNISIGNILSFVGRSWRHIDKADENIKYDGHHVHIFQMYGNIYRDVDSVLASCW